MGFNWRVLIGTLATGILLLLVPGVSSAATTEDNGRGPGGTEIHAVMDYAELGSPQYGKKNNVKLLIERDGKKALGYKPNPKGSCGGCGYFAGDPAVEVVQLDRTPEPEVIFNIFTGGAHCCTTSLIYRYAGGKYRLKKHDWGNFPYQLRKIKKKPRLISYDDRFAYRFDSFLDSRFPIQVFKYNKGRMKQVTRRYPGLVRKDARSHQKVWRKARKSGRAAAPLAAWYADQCLLNRCARSFKKVKRLVRKKRAVREYVYGNNRAYLKNLRTTIKRFGYAR